MGIVNYRARNGFEPGSGQVGFVVDKVALGQVFSEYFGFFCQSPFHQLLHNHPHLSSGSGTIGQMWPQSHPTSNKQNKGETITGARKQPLYKETTDLLLLVVKF
jgi:hypothetical protein